MEHLTKIMLNTCLKWHARKKEHSYIVRVSSLWDCSEHFTYHPLADLFIPTPFQFLREAFSHAAITVFRLFIHISTSVSWIWYSFIQLSELWQHGLKKIAAGVFEPRFSLLRDWHSNHFHAPLDIKTKFFMKNT